MSILLQIVQFLTGRRPSMAECRHLPILHPTDLRFILPSPLSSKLRIPLRRLS